MDSIFERIIEVQQKHMQELLAKRNVVGVATGYRRKKGQVTDTPAVAVLVQQKKPIAALNDEDMVPETIDGVRTDVIEVGYLQAMGTAIPDLSAKGRYRPNIPAGVSISHYKVTAGVIGAVVKDRTTGERLILSNNHVLANANEAVAGDPILQPATLDGGENPQDAVATLARFIPLIYVEGDVKPPPQPNDEPKTPVKSGGDTGCDVVDAFVAIGNMFAQLSGSQKRVTASAAQPTAASAQNAKDNALDAALAKPNIDGMFETEIRNIGRLNGTATPELNMQVIKTGRTTDTTTSKITLLNATVSIAYNTSQGVRNAQFSGQVICDVFSQPGDSGALVVDQATNKAVGLLFAGSTLASIFTPIDVVLNALNVDLEV